MRWDNATIAKRMNKKLDEVDEILAEQIYIAKEEL